MKRLIILNPKSRAGNARSAFKALEGEIRKKLGPFELYETSGPMDASGRVRQALKDKKFGQIIVAGGDGSINEAVNGYFENGKIINQKVPLGVISMGTGSDFIKTLRQLSAVYDVALQKNTFKLVDVGQVRSEKDQRFFINIASAGIAGKIMESLKSSRFQHGSPAYYFHTVKSLFLYNPEQVKLTYEDEHGHFHTQELKLLNFFACNGRFNGGGMNWAPAADLQDGLFNGLIVGDVSKTRMVMASSRVYAGHIEGFPGATEFKARRMTLESKKRILGEADGEVYGSDAPARVDYELFPACFPLVL
ncbi:MAG: diacylglycerol kinase family protein [Leptospiraceae bacterium]